LQADLLVVLVGAGRPSSLLPSAMTNYSTYLSRMYGNDEYDFEEEAEEMEDEVDGEAEESDEDTEEASETELRKSESLQEVPDIKESFYSRMYLEKLNAYKYQLQQLCEGNYPEYNRRVKRLEQQYKERLRLNTTWRDHLMDLTEKDFVAEKKAAAKELDEKVIELKENLIQDMEEKKKIIEAERVTMELSGDSAETKPAMTRKLRRRPNDPAPIPEKRRGKMSSLPSQINFQLDDKEIESDLKAIMKGVKTGASLRKPGKIVKSSVSSNGLQSLGQVVRGTPTSETRIEDGKLLYERRWYHRGQTVYVEGISVMKFAGVISGIRNEMIIIKKVVDSTKCKISLSMLEDGKITIKRRAS